MAPQVIALRYHRNGVCGRGFFTVRFTDADAARDGGLPASAEFLATVTSEGRGRTRKGERIGRKETGDCYVVALLAPEMNWRGDNFEGFVLGCLNAAPDSHVHGNPGVPPPVHVARARYTAQTLRDAADFAEAQVGKGSPAVGGFRRHADETDRCLGTPECCEHHARGGSLRSSCEGDAPKKK